MTFWQVVARLYGRFSWPRKTSLNWFIPAFVKRSVGSSAGTSDDDGTRRCPRASKNDRNVSRTSREVQSLLAGIDRFALPSERLEHGVRREAAPHEVVEEF